MRSSRSVQGATLGDAPALLAQGEPASGLWRAQMLLYLLPLLTLVILSAAVIAGGHAPFPRVDYAGIDHLRYLAMATHPFGPDLLVHEPPYAWRVLSPWVVHIMPFSPVVGFLLLTVVSLLGATAGLMWFLRGLGLPPTSVISGGLAFVLLWPATGFTLWDYMLVDPLAFALIALACAATVRSNGIVLALALVLGTLDKETCMLAALFALAWAVQRRNWALLRWAIAGSLAAIAALVGLRIAIPVSQSYSFLTAFQTIYAGYTLHMVWSRLTEATGVAWTLLLPFAALQVAHPPRVWRSWAFALLFLGACAQCLVATDVARLVVYAFPVMIAAVAFEVEYLTQRLRVASIWWWSLILLVELVWWLDTWKATTATTGSYVADLPALVTADRVILPLSVIVVCGVLARDLVRHLRRRHAYDQVTGP